MNDSTVVAQTHSGGVTDRPTESGRVEEPVAANIEGRDGKMVLCESGQSSGVLTDAVSQVQQGDNTPMGDGGGFNTVVFVEPGTGMSMPHSKLA